MRILVIDDDEALAQTLKRILRGHDVSVETESTSGLTRVECAELDGQPFEVVICDYQLPGSSGLEVLAALRTRREPPLLILTSGMDGIADSARVADAVLVKPFRSQELRATIARLRAERSHAATIRYPRVRNTTFDLGCLD